MLFIAAAMVTPAMGKLAIAVRHTGSIEWERGPSSKDRCMITNEKNTMHV